jgi:hypothetical protein
MTTLNTKVRQDVMDVLADLSNLMVVIDANKDAVREAIKALSEKTGIGKSQLNMALKAYHKGQINETTDNAVETADLLDLLFLAPTTQEDQA